MRRERLNPYLVLGIPYASPIREVLRAFAKRSRVIRNGDFDSYSLENLTWAKHRIEQAERDPELDLTMYRVPANPDSFVDDIDNSNSEGFFNPPIRRIERKSPLPSKEECDQFLFSAMSKWFLETVSDEKIDLVHPFDVLASR